MGGQAPVGTCAAAAQCVDVGATWGGGGPRAGYPWAWRCYDPSVPTTFLVWDTTLHSLVDTLVYLREHDASVLVRPVPGDLAHGHLWDDNVRPDLERADRVLAIVDEPNGNMAFELGYALGQGKPYTLLAAGHTRPEWLKNALLKDLIVNTGGEDLETLQRVLAEARWAPAPHPAQAVADPVGAFGWGRVIRGGGYWDDADWCRSAYRDRRRSSYGNGFQGFRVRLPAP